MKIPILEKLKKSTQLKILLSFLGVIILPSALVSISSYYISVWIIKDKVSATFSQAVVFAKAGVESELRQVQQITDYIFLNEDVKKLTTGQGTEYERIKTEERVKQVFANYSIAKLFKNINSVKIFDGEKQVFNYEQNDAGFYIFDNASIQNSNGYVSAVRSKGKMILAGISRDFFEGDRPREDHISFFRAITDREQTWNMGMMYISLQPRAFMDVVQSLDIKSRNNIYIVDNNNRIINSYVSEEATNEVVKAIRENDGKNRTIVYEDKTAKQLIFYHSIEGFDWKVIGIIPLKELTRDVKSVFYVTAVAFLISLVFCGFIWFFVLHRILRPIKILTDAVGKVTKGALDVTIRPLGEDEIGTLASSFNFMLERIKRLIGEIVEEHNRVKDEEYKALQAQINPHFLYNTLNSIRWMAIIQKADNIKQVVEALGRLLKNTTSKMDRFITLREELRNLEDYIYIEKLAYKGKFEVEWAIDESLLDQHCIKFLLQPVMENAIFHGIEPRAGRGKIQISISRSQDEIEVVIYDNGVGMTQEQIQNTLEQPGSSRKGFSGIGINNINQRMIMAYGSQYGVQIESEVGSHTRVVLRIPMSKNIGFVAGLEDQNAQSVDC